MNPLIVNHEVCEVSEIAEIEWRDFIWAGIYHEHLHNLLDREYPEVWRDTVVTWFCVTYGLGPRSYVLLWGNKTVCNNFGKLILANLHRNIRDNCIQI